MRQKNLKLVLTVEKIISTTIHSVQQIVVKVTKQRRKMETTTDINSVNNRPKWITRRNMEFEVRHHEIYAELFVCSDNTTMTTGFLDYKQKAELITELEKVLEDLR